MPEQLLYALINAGGIGILAVVLYILHSRSLDTIDKEREIGRQRDVSKDAHHESIVSAMMIVFSKELRNERETCERRRSESSEQTERRHGETSQALGLLHGTLREVVHDQKNIANQVVMHQAVVSAALGLRKDLGKPMPEPT